MKPDGYRLVNTSKFPIRWGDMDALGHVNNSTYFTYFEYARTEWFREVFEDWQNSEHGPVVVTIDCTFLKPIVYPATIQVQSYVSPPGRSSFTIYSEINEVAQNTLVATGNCKIVWVNWTKQKSMPLPLEIRSALPA